MKNISNKFFEYIDVFKNSHLADVYPDGSKRDWREIVSYPSAHMFATGCITRRLGDKPDFEWNRLHYSASAFDDINFRYKNMVFSILLKFFYNGEEIPINKKRETEWLEIAKQNNLIPCIFPVDIIDDDTQYAIRRKTDGWHLFYFNTKVEIDPTKISSEKTMLMSHYDLLNNAIKTVEFELENDGFEVRATCDNPNLPEDYPRIWFVDKKGNICWVVVKYGINTNFKTPNVKKIIQNDSILNDSTGYFAPVVFEPDGKPMYRSVNVPITLLEGVIGKIYNGSEKKK